MDTGEDEDDGAARSIIAPQDAAGARVDAFLAGVWPDLSRARIQGLIGQGKLTADGAIVTAARDKVRAGCVYELTLPPPAPADPLPEALPLTIVHEDGHLLVIDKAAGMAMHPAPGAMTGTLVNAVLHHCGATLSGIGGVARPGIVHRIDRDTTGLVVIAKDNTTHAHLGAQFAKHTIERMYCALTRGAPLPRNGVIETRLARSSADRKKMAVVSDTSTAGKHAITHYWTIDSFGQQDGAAAGRGAAALVECRLKTGRTHQIRVHLAHIGAPLIGDPVYGKMRGLKASGARAQTVDAAARAFPRQALHAAVLGLIHPITGAAMRFESALPPDMAGLLEALKTL
jgi:23S rRNA pseudouridine1911/1915/1917 synthase